MQEHFLNDRKPIINDFLMQKLLAPLSILKGAFSCPFCPEHGVKLLKNYRKAGRNMNKEALLSLGLTEEQANKVMDSLGGDFVANTDFQAVSEENKTLQKSLAERDKQLEDLKKSSGDNAELQKQIEALQQQNAEQKKAHEAELASPC